jgi:DNA-binding NtrC family response regulator
MPTILLVDDDDLTNELVSLQLESVGYQVLTASSAKEALDLFKQNSGRIDLLFSDLILPGEVNGKDLADQLHLLQPNLKVLLMSGYSTYELESRGIHLENVEFIAKPFSLASMQRKLRSIGL